MGAPAASPPLRVAVVQFVVPHYRVPLFNRLSRLAGVELEVFSEPANSIDTLQPALEGAEFRHFDAPIRRRGPFLSQPVLGELCRAARHDVLITHWNTRLLQLFPALVAARRRGLRTLLWGHGTGKSPSIVRRLARDRALALSDGCILYSHRAERELLAGGVAPGALHVARNAVDTAPIDAAIAEWSAPDRLAEFQRRNQLVNRDLIVFVSRVERAKRPDLLLRAFAVLRRRRPDARLAIIGGGSALDASRTLARELGAAEAVAFTGPLYDEMTLAPWLLSARCAAFPADVGLGVLHAFGYGLPVVTNDSDTLHGPEIEALRDGTNGLRFRLDDVEDLAQTIARLLDDRERRATLAAAARATVRGPDGWTLDRMVAGFAEALAAVRPDRERPEWPRPAAGARDTRERRG